MPQVKKQLEINDFSGGFNTEQSPLKADPSTTKEEQNLVLASDGSRARRYGYNEEQDSAVGITLGSLDDMRIPTIQLNDFNSPNAAVSTGNWSFKNFTLILDSKSRSPVATSTVDWNVYLSSESNIVTSAGVYDTFQYNPISTSAYYKIDNYNIIAKSDYLLYPTADAVTIARHSNSSKTFDTTISTLKVRDLWGVDDTLGIVERPATMSANHLYNLFNQGWTAESIYKFFTEIGKYPSNGDLSYFGLVLDDSATVNYVYDTGILKDVPLKEGAPKGRFELSTASPSTSRDDAPVLAEFTAFNALAGTSLSPTAINNVLTGLNPGLVINSATSFLGRAFYSFEAVRGSGFTTPNNGEFTPSFANAILFSRVIEGIDDSSSANLSTPTRCTSIVEPTSEEFTPTSTDGGIIFVDGAHKVLGTRATRDSLLIIASNGIWELRAQDGFTPATFVLAKLLSAEIVNTRGIVEVEGSYLVPTQQGIFYLSYDAESRRTISRNLSDPVIRKFYNLHRLWISASVYDSTSHEVRWLLQTPLPELAEGASVEMEVEQIELVLDTRLGSFYINRLPTCNAKALSATKRIGFNSGSVGYKNIYALPATAGSVFISGYVALPNPYYVGPAGTPIDDKRNGIQVKLVCVDTDTGDVLIADQYNKSFADFGIEAEAYMVTNPVTMNDTVHIKNFGEVWTHFYRTEDGFEDDGSGDWVPTNPSGCLMSGRFDFSDSAASGKWTTPRQAYRYPKDYMPVDINDTFDYGHYIITNKHSIPGQGLALSLKFESEEGKDFQLIGWGAYVQVNRST